MRLPVACLTLCALFPTAGGAPAPHTAPQRSGTPNLAKSVVLDGYVESHGARCLDGTAPRYWLQTASGANASKWYVHYMGGGWCESIDSCTERGFSQKCYLGSSKPECFEYQQGDMIPGVKFNETMDFDDIPSCLGARWCGGLMINDPARNPVTHDWNKVLLQYCDGGSYSGNNETATMVTVGGQQRPIYFRGLRNFEATIADLKARFGLGSATDLVLSGDSAGGLATYIHADRWAAELPRARVMAAPDSGYFLVDPERAQHPGSEGWPAALDWIVSAMNSTSGLNARCVAAMGQRGDPASLCIRPNVVAPFVETPLFVMNSKIDPALDSIVAHVSSNGTDINRLAGILVDLVNTTLLTQSKNAAFVTACREHCGQWAQGQHLGPKGAFDDFNVTIAGVTAPVALGQWLRGEAPGRLWLQEAMYPCADCCHGGN